jgi:hypothetical protein
MIKPGKPSSAVNQSAIPAMSGGGGGPGVPAVPNSPSVGTSPGGPGVLGQSNTGAGLRGESIGEGGGGVGGVHQVYQPPGDGVFGQGATGVHGVGTIGVYGVSEGNGQGVLGESTGNGPGVSGTSKGGDGVYGTSAHNGVHGMSASSADSGVWGENTGGGYGVSGSSAKGWGVYGSSQNGQAALFQGQVHITQDLNVDGRANLIGHVLCENGLGVNGLSVIGDMSLDGNLNITNKGDVVLSDCAEHFDVVDANTKPGTVMVIDQDGNLRPSSRPYDKKVAGVVSGAGNYRPGIILGQHQSQHKGLPIALFGKVYCRVDARDSAIEIGDLLTTSRTSGHAMKAQDPVNAFGAVIGKALKPLKEGQGLIPILVALQ